MIFVQWALLCANGVLAAMTFVVIGIMMQEDKRVVSALVIGIVFGVNAVMFFLLMDKQ